MIDFQKYIISEKASIKDALVTLNKLSGDVLTLFVIDKNGCMTGTLTDGDIRRKLVEGYTLEEKVVNAMHTDFRYVEDNNVDVEKIKAFREAGIILLPTLDTGRHIVRVYNLKKRRSILPFDAVLMAGGKGERLRPLTEHTPKPLLKVGGKAIIDYNVDRLISFGVEHISVTVNYLKEQLESHFEEPREGIQVKCVREPAFLGTMGSLKFVNTFHNDVVLVMNSDLFTNIDYEYFYLSFVNCGADVLAAAIPYTVNIPYGVFDLEESVIKGIEEKPAYDYYVNAGIYLIKRELLDQIPDNTYYDATDLIKKLATDGYKVVRFPLTGYWIDIGKHEDYKRVQELVEHL